MIGHTLEVVYPYDGCSHFSCIFASSIPVTSLVNPRVNWSSQNTLEGPKSSDHPSLNVQAFVFGRNAESGVTPPRSSSSPTRPTTASLLAL